MNVNIYYSYSWLVRQKEKSMLLSKIESKLERNKSMVEQLESLIASDLEERKKEGYIVVGNKYSCKLVLKLAKKLKQRKKLQRELDGDERSKLETKLENIRSEVECLEECVVSEIEGRRKSGYIVSGCTVGDKLAKKLAKKLKRRRKLYKQLDERIGTVSLLDKQTNARLEVENLEARLYGELDKRMGSETQEVNYELIAKLANELEKRSKVQKKLKS